MEKLASDVEDGGSPAAAAAAAAVCFWALGLGLARYYFGSSSSAETAPAVELEPELEPEHLLIVADLLGSGSGAPAVDLAYFELRACNVPVHDVNKNVDGLEV